MVGSCRGQMTQPVGQEEADQYELMSGNDIIRWCHWFG